MEVRSFLQGKMWISSRYILKLDCHSFKAFRYSRGLQPLILLNTLE